MSDDPQPAHDPLDDLLLDPWQTWITERQRAALHLPEFRRAAVLVGLTREPDPRVLLTVRSSELPTHKGQVSFPGGSLEAGETPVQAALREAWEEVGLNAAAVTALGELDDVFTPIGFHVTPVLARLPAEPQLTLSGEVVKLLLPSLSDLRAIVPREDQRTLPDGQQVTLYTYPWGGHDIWGMTARVLHDLLAAGPQQKSR